MTLIDFVHVFGRGRRVHYVRDVASKSHVIHCLNRDGIVRNVEREKRRHWKRVSKIE